MKDYLQLLLENKAWAYEKEYINPDYFKEMAKVQTPRFLWIGCADSRVPPNEITGTLPGDMFVHRNIANLVVENDLSLLSVLTYGIKYLKIKHIILCGHYGCGGVASSMTDQSFGIIDGWLKGLKDLQKIHVNELKKVTDPAERTNRLVELSVLSQVEKLRNIKFIQETWESGQELYIHGWVYDMSTGLIKDLIQIEK
ncbi:MAG: carbonic anhydrase [Bacteriovoracaceae bacterium]|nr:carbonic anhydrase [Bacteriovoracaceae bacterium]